jgi:hypothetical protein
MSDAVMAIHPRWRLVMSSRLTRWNALAWASALALAAALAACGGGGGDDDDSGPPGTIDLSVANRDTVAHAVVAGAIGLGGADAVVSGAGSVAAQRQLALSLRAARERALAVIGPLDEACAVSGLTRTTLDDRDNDGLPSAGDVMTLQFLQCKDSVEETIDGTTTITLTQFGASGFAGSMQQSALAMVREDGGQQHAVTLNGTMQMTFSVSSQTLGTLRLVASGPIVAAVSTPVFADTVTLMSGYTQHTVIDTEAAPPPGGMTPGRSSTTGAGRIASQAAGGEVTVVTVDAIVQYADDAFARTGTLQVTGRTGSLRITAVSPTDVRLDLDANGDGTIDVTTTQRWDWLI